jgi:hypothetical protein
LAGDLHNVALSFLGTTDTRPSTFLQVQVILVNSNSSKYFSTKSEFPLASCHQTDKGQRQAMALLNTQEGSHVHIAYPLDFLLLPHRWPRHFLNDTKPGQPLSLNSFPPLTLIL